MQPRASGEVDTQPEKALLKRMQFDFSPDALKRLEALKTRTNAATLAEVLQHALMVYEWMVDHVEPDETLEIQDEKGKPVFCMSAKALLL